VSPAAFLAGLALLAAVPAGVLLLLAVIGALAWLPALLSLAAVLASSAVLAALWVHDLEKLAETLRHAALENSAALAKAAAAPRLPAMERLARAIERLSRTLAARAAQVGLLLRANEAIVERLPDPLLVLGADRSVRRTNAAARAAFGADIPAVLRHPVLRAAIDRAVETGEPQTADLSLPVPVPREVQATVIMMDVLLGEGGAGGGQVLAVLSDRSRERAVERMRADFVANAGHELRTPLASLIGFIETLRGPAASDPPAQRRFLGIMAEQAERMNRLIDDLLSLSRIELTEHQAPADHVNLGELAESVLAGFEPRLAPRRIRLERNLPPSLPPVLADADQVAQVIQNLVDNAVKYGREGGTVQVSAAASVPGDRWPARPGVVLSVADDGPGIPRAHVPRLTERFYRVDSARSRSAGGTGLGLAIVKHVVNRHRGQLAIESTEGKGSVFSVWLPCAEGR
jgi:two-component system, OmpR family, phosphate regulon sensor histidine kinase PhoR